MSKIERPVCRNLSFFMVALGLLIILNGCSGGTLTTREKGAQGSVRWAALFWCMRPSHV